MTAMLSKRDVLPPPCGPTKAMARGPAFILVERSLQLSWDMCASAFENPLPEKQWLRAVVPRSRAHALVQGKCSRRWPANASLRGRLVIIFVARLEQVRHV